MCKKHISSHNRKACMENFLCYYSNRIFLLTPWRSKHPDRNARSAWCSESWRENLTRKLINREEVSLQIKVREKYRFVLEIFIEGNLDAKKKGKGENKKFATFSLFRSVYQQLAVSFPASLMLMLFLTITLQHQSA